MRADRGEKQGPNTEQTGPWTRGEVPARETDPLAREQENVVP